MNDTDRETQILENIVPELEAEGYTVFLHPSSKILPPFMQWYIPDAVAFGSPKNLPIEITSENSSSNTKLNRISELFRQVKDWELRVYYIRPTTTQSSVEVAPRATIEESLRTIEKLISQGQTQPALLMTWATLEALGRALLPGKFTRPQTPGRLLEVLASDGYVTPSEADVLRRLVPGRVRLIHGDLGVNVDPADLAQSVTVLRTLLRLLQASHSAVP